MSLSLMHQMLFLGVCPPLRLSFCNILSRAFGVDAPDGKDTKTNAESNSERVKVAASTRCIQRM